MASLPTGSNDLVFIQTKKVNITIKGSASHPVFQDIEYKEGDASFSIACNDEYELSLDGEILSTMGINISNTYSGVYSIRSLFYEQQRYEIVIQTNDNSDVAFWHDNINIRNKVTPVGNTVGLLTGVISFGNEIGFSDFIIKVDGVNYLRFTVEVFPTKISYKEDYKAILDDVTREIYSLVFDFLKRTYQGYQLGDQNNSSPVEFFSIIQHIFKDFLKSIDIILTQPHHILETTHEVLPIHKVKRTDVRSLQWLEKHPEHVKRCGDRFQVEKVLAVKKQITYDTKENQLTKYIINSIIKKLESFKSNYLNLRRGEDKIVVSQIDEMIRNLSRRSNKSFLSSVSDYDHSSGMSLVFSMAPGYRDLYKYYLMLMRGLSITGDVFHVSLKDLAVLYEYWCFIKLNSLMKNNYKLETQNIVKVQGNGLYVTLSKGVESYVKYRNPLNEETIILSYNPKKTKLPTGAQKPDNVLSIKKKGMNAEYEYEYLFDAK